MSDPIDIDILRQPDDSTCGPTCLQAIYRYWQDARRLADIIDEVRQLDAGGTLGVLLGEHALELGYDVRIYTYNLLVFDPTWVGVPNDELRDLLAARIVAKQGDEKLVGAIKAYCRFLELGGEIRQQVLTAELLVEHFAAGEPILTGLSATYLYQCAREVGEVTLHYDPVQGDPQGHFVVLRGYDASTRKVAISDPLGPNPMATSQAYEVDIDRLLCSILLGVLTYDANLVVIRPRPNTP